MSTKTDILNAILKNRNQEVLNQLYKTALPKVRSFVLKNSGNSDDAKDIFQDAVIVFFHSVKTAKFDESKSIDGFIYTVARNAWINKVRHDKKLVFKDELPEDFNTNQDNQLDDIISKERQDAFRKVFMMLGEQCRELMQLSIYEEMPPREITNLLKISNVEVTRTNLYRCRKKLTSLIKANKQTFSITE